jgi:hypothetical protein
MWSREPRQPVSNLIHKPTDWQGILPAPLPGWIAQQPIAARVMIPVRAVVTVIN